MSEVGFKAVLLDENGALTSISYGLSSCITYSLGDVFVPNEVDGPLAAFEHLRHAVNFAYSHIQRDIFKRGWAVHIYLCDYEPSDEHSFHCHGEGKMTGSFPNGTVFASQIKLRCLLYKYDGRQLL